MFENYALIKALKILRFKELSIRELAKEAKISPSTAKACLDYLLEKNVAKKRVLGRSHYYKFDLDNFLARQIKIMLSLKELNDSQIKEELMSKYSDISSIILYGSVSRGDDDEKSDIDILIISRKDIKIHKLEAEKSLEKELSIIFYTTSEWRKKSKEDKVFYDRVIVEGTALYGEIPMVN